MKYFFHLDIDADKKILFIYLIIQGTLMKYFFHLDIDADKKIDTKEFMAILEEDVSITDILNHDNPVLRG